MLEKLKSVLQIIKQYLLWVLTPVLVIGGYIYYLLSKIGQLNSKVVQLEAEKDIAKTLDKKLEVEHEASVNEATYDQLRSEYMHEHSDSTGPSDTSSTSPKP